MIMQKEIFLFVVKGRKRTNMSGSASVFRDPHKYSVWCCGYDYYDSFDDKILTPTSMTQWSD